MMTPTPSTHSPALEPALARRYSPRAFTTDVPDSATLRTLFAAAGSAASCFNEQPWRFVVGMRGDDTWQKLFDALVPFNQQWARLAPVLVLSVARTTFANGEPNAHAWHDVGQAVASMAIQASALGLQIHQMAGFDADAARTAFSIPRDHAPVALIAIGVPGSPELLPDVLRERERSRSSRRALEEFVYSGGWGLPTFSHEN